MDLTLLFLFEEKAFPQKGFANNSMTSSYLFLKISKISEVKTPQINGSKSFKPLFTKNEKIRDYQYSKMNSETIDSWTISNGNYKLMVRLNSN